MSDVYIEDSDYDWMEEADVSMMLDEGRIFDRQEGAASGYNRRDESWTPRGSTTICNFRKTSLREIQQVAQVEVSDANVLLPMGTIIRKGDRFRLLRRGRTPTSEDFEMVGEPHIGASSIYCKLQKVRR